MAGSDPLSNALLDDAAFGIARGEHADALAARLNVTTRTIRNWKRRPEFQQRVAFFRTEMVGTVSGRIAAFAIEGAARLGELLKSSDKRLVLRAALGLCKLTGMTATTQLADEVAQLRVEIREMKQAKK